MPQYDDSIAQELLDESSGRVTVICERCGSEFRATPKRLKHLSIAKRIVQCKACNRKVQSWIAETSHRAEPKSTSDHYRPHPGWNPRDVGHWYDMHPREPGERE